MGDGKKQFIQGNFKLKILWHTDVEMSGGSQSVRIVLPLLTKV